MVRLKKSLRTVRSLRTNGRRCAYTGLTLSPSNIAFTPVRPGYQSPDAMLPCTETVARAKGKLSHPDFVALCRTIGQYVKDDGWCYATDGQIEAANSTCHVTGQPIEKDHAVALEYGDAHQPQVLIVHESIAGLAVGRSIKDITELCQQILNHQGLQNSNESTKDIKK